MTIDWLKDKETGIKFYPVTHEDAVIDSNGNTLSTNLGNKSDKSTTVTNVSYDSSSKKILKTINGTTSDVVTLTTVATSGSYNDLSNKPTIPAALILSDWNLTTTTAKDYIKNKPNIVIENGGNNSSSIIFLPSNLTINAGSVYDLYLSGHSVDINGLIFYNGDVVDANGESVLLKVLNAWSPEYNTTSDIDDTTLSNDVYKVNFYELEIDSISNEIIGEHLSKGLLIHNDNTQYLIKDNEIKYRVYENNTWSEWQSGTPVTSVNGMTGDVVLTYDDIVHNYSKDYLTFEAVEAGTFTLTIGANVSTSYVTSISYSLDNGSTWTTTNNVDSLTVTITTPTIAIGDKVLWKGLATALATTTVTSSLAAASRLAEVCNFSSTGSYDISGNIMSLLYNDDFLDKDYFATGSSRNFALLFYGYDATTGTKIANAENLIFPAKICPDYCYYRIFQWSALITPPHVLATSIGDYGCANFCYKCPNLIRTSEIGATTMGTYGYAYAYHTNTSLKEIKEFPEATMETYGYVLMFYGCSAIKKIPRLSATTLAGYCYREMFFGCSSLETIPELPATTLANYCYYGMFQECSSLKEIPELLATNLAIGCYALMFGTCSSLILGPKILPATTLYTLCYAYMFAECTSLLEAPELPATTLAEWCYGHMFESCTSLKKAPVLPATALISASYRTMFANCSKLQYIECLAEDLGTSESSLPTLSWSGGVSPTGTFVTADNAPAWTRGSNGIPTGWNVYTKSEYEVVRHYELGGGNITPILYDDLKDLRDNSQLVPGTYYRITDYETFVSGSLKSAGHLFDIIVMALTENTLSEDAYACKSDRDNEMTEMDIDIDGMKAIRYSIIDGDYQNEHYYGFIVLDNNVLYIYTKDITTTPETIYGFLDSNNNIIPITDSENIANVVSNNVVPSCTFGYFTNSNLAAWKLKYCLEGNGKYEWEGSLTPPYVTYDGAYGNYVRNSGRDQDGLYGWTYYGGRENYHCYTNSNFPQIGDLLIFRGSWGTISSVSSNYITVSGYLYTRDSSYDAGQLYAWVNSTTGSIYYTSSETPSSSLQLYYRSSTTLISEVGAYGNKGVIYQMIDEFNNNCPYDFKNIIYDGSYTFNIGNISNGEESEPLHLAIDNSLNIFGGIYCHNNLISPVAFRNNNYTYPCNYFISNYCYGNILESNCYGNIFYGDSTVSNTLKLDCEENLFNNSNYNIIGAGCHHNTFGYDFLGNIIGNGVNSCVFGPECWNNVIGTGCSYIYFFHTYLQNVEIRANCDYIYIEKDYVLNIIVEPGNNSVTITSTLTTSESNKLQNFTIAQGVGQGGTTKTISHNTVNDTFRTVYQPVNSVIVSV